MPSTGQARDHRATTDSVAAAKMVYFAPVAQWPAVERRAPAGRAEGCWMPVWARASGSANCSGVEASVVGIDVSPGAVEVARGRGVRDVRLLAFEEVDEIARPLRHDRHARKQLRPLRLAEQGPALAPAAPPAGRQDRGSARMTPMRRRPSPSRVSGAQPQSAAECRDQLRLRNRYRDAHRSWFDYLIVSPDEMATILEGYTVADPQTARRERQRLLRAVLE